MKRSFVIQPHRRTLTSERQKGKEEKEEEKKKLHTIIAIIFSPSLYLVQLFKFDCFTYLFCSTGIGE